MEWNRSDGSDLGTWVYLRAGKSLWFLHASDLGLADGGAKAGACIRELSADARMIRSRKRR